MAFRHAEQCERCGAVLRVVAQFVDRNHYPPTIRQIGDRSGISSTSLVKLHLRALEERGHLRLTPGISRGIALTEAGREAAA
jgi:repressor LexA